MTRSQRQRTRGWRMPPTAVYVGRPSPWGNPFPVDGDYAMWWALAMGHMADAAGRREAAVAGYRWFLGGPLPIRTRETVGGAIEYTSGAIRTVASLVDGFGLFMLGALPPLELPPTPDLAPLRGHDLVCWCPPDQPCHADVLLELLGERP